MKTFTDEGLYDDAQFEAWNQVLGPLGRLRCQGRLGGPGGGPGSELMEPLYDIAQELRDRLRFSQLRMHQLKAEVRKLQGLMTMERQQAAEALTEERLQAHAKQQQVQEQLLCERDKIQALLRQTQEELLREKGTTQALLRQTQEELLREKGTVQAMLRQAQEELLREKGTSQALLRQAQDELLREKGAAQALLRQTQEELLREKGAAQALRQAQEELLREKGAAQALRQAQDELLRERAKVQALLRQSQEELAHEKGTAQAMLRQSHEELAREKARVQALLRQTQEELQHEKGTTQAMLRQSQEELAREKARVQALLRQTQEELQHEKGTAQALVRQSQEELQREKSSTQATQARLRQTQEELVREKDKTQAVARQVQDEIRAERARSQEALVLQQQRAREHLEVECKAAQDHAAVECRKAHEALRKVEAQLREERARGNDDKLQERQKATMRLAELEAQIRHLNQAIQDQDAQLASQRQLNTELQKEMATARYGTNITESQLNQAEDRAERAEAAQRSLLSELTSLRLELEDWRRQAAQSEGRHNNTVQALLDTKSQLGELSHLQGLYLAAREELARLDKENAELKEMVQSEVYELSQSRILGTLSPGRRDKSTPMFLTPELHGKRRPKSSYRLGSPGRSTSPYRDRVLAATGVIYPPDLAADIEGMVSAVRAPPPPYEDGLGSVAAAAQLAQLAFLGPPTSAYPTDPDKFVFVRVAGGFSPKYVGSEPLPKASGWIPKEVVRLAQAFKHSHSIDLEWRAWEPFLLLINEVYHTIAGGGVYHGGQYGSGAYLKAGGRNTAGGTKTLAYRPSSARPASPGPRQELEVLTSEATRRYLSRMASYSSVVQAERIMALRKELMARSRSRGRSGARSAREERERDSFLRTMAEKDYHIMNELGEVVGENQQLRRSMQQYMD